jgi:hypothetical protein
MTNVRRIAKRLERLEDLAAVPDLGQQFAEVQRNARRKLSIADCDLLAGAIAARGERSEILEAVWKRWEIALSRAFEESDCSITLTAADLLL